MKRFKHAKSRHRDRHHRAAKHAMPHLPMSSEAMLDRLFSGESYELASARLSQILEHGFERAGQSRHEVEELVGTRAR
jgi:hypothetical protein